MSRLVFLPGFDGAGELRKDFTGALAPRHEVRVVSYPRAPLGSLDRYREHAMAHVPVDWGPVLVAESFSGLVAAHWAAMDPRVAGLVLVATFARNPVGEAARLGAAWPGLVKIGPSFLGMLTGSSDALRRRWSSGLSRAMAALPDEVVSERLRLIAREDTGPLLAGLKVPKLIVHFDSDIVIGAAARAYLEAVCHNAQVLRLPGPHFAIETRPRECAEAIGGRIHAMFARQA
ncbi:MAG TPA: alpha/beta fold hydrolase [Usitatibacter sp.]|nr:alpha/beta fold hydrolase [Usitatibacter sp.]